MRKIFALMPIFGGFGFLFGAYIFYVSAKHVSPWMYLFAGFFVVLAIGFFLWGIRWLTSANDESVGSKEGQTLKQTGLKTMAQIVNIEHVTNVRINMRAPYVIHAKALSPITNQEQIFKSHWLWTDPMFQLKDQTQVEVYIDPNNPLKYYMDLLTLGIAGEPNKSSTIIVGAAILIPFIGLLIAGAVAYNNYKKYQPLIPDASNINEYIESRSSTSSNWQSSEDETAKCMKKLYGDDVFVKLQEGKFIPPADIGQRIQNCVTREK